MLLRRLGRLAELSAGEAEDVRLRCNDRRQHAARSELYGEGALCPARFILSGWGARHHILSDGRRQIVSLLLPGDLVGPSLQPRLPSACSGVALTAMETIDVAPLAEHAYAVAPAQSGLSRAFHLLDRLDEAAARNQIVRLGRQTAYERTLHLLLELRDRLAPPGLAGTGLEETGLEGIGLEVPDRYVMPLTQEVLADVLGITVVHVNRTLQQARREGLIELKAGSVTLRQTNLIEAVADWHPIPKMAD